MRTFAILCIAALAGCATTGQNAPGASEPDPGLQASLEAYVNDANSHIAQGDFAYLKASACPDVVMWDTDENGNPMEAVGQAAVGAVLDRYTALAHTPGVTMTTTFGPIKCETYADAGFCMVPMDQTMTQNGQTMGPFKVRGTLIAKQYKGRWIWTHWHASMREAPAAPPPASPAAAPAAAPAPTTPAPAAIAPAPAAPAAPVKK
jgi:hypothetical protein